MSGRIQPRTTPPILGLVTLALAFTSTGCVAPFSEMQGARLAGPGNWEVTPSYSWVAASGDGETDKVQDNFAVQLATGLNERVDLRMRYELIRLSGDDLSGDVFHAVGLGPKIGLVEDRVALYAPVGFGFGGDIDISESLQLHPTVLFTLPAGDHVEINPSAKAQIWLNNSGADNLLAFNLGLGVGPDLDRWAVRPEVGLLVNPGEEGRFWHFSLGFSRTIDGG